MKIKQEDDGRKGSFLAVTKENAVVGEMSYLWSDNNNMIIIDHTGVEPQYTGEGVGHKLVMTAVGFARTNNIKILPICRFAVGVFNKNPDISDVRILE